jgi:pimeloyl-ACP methyl ester carboxylesterase
MIEATGGGGVRSGYTPVNGLDMYYEVHGDGQPLVLLHGAFSAIGANAQCLDEHGRVVVAACHGVAQANRPVSTVPSQDGDVINQLGAPEDR